MENLLSWTGTLVQWNAHTEFFTFMKIAKNHTDIPICPIEAEIRAIERITIIRTTHRLNGIERSDQVYHYMKAAIMEQIEKGMYVEDEHRTQDIILN